MKQMTEASNGRRVERRAVDKDSGHARSLQGAGDIILSVPAPFLYIELVVAVAVA